MAPDQLASAARNLAYGLGIPVYIRDGRIYENGPGLAFLPPKGTHPTVADAPSHEEEDTATDADTADRRPGKRSPRMARKLMLGAFPTIAVVLLLIRKGRSFGA